jgi:hypothetical protein
MPTSSSIRPSAASSAFSAAAWSMLCLTANQLEGLSALTDRRLKATLPETRCRATAGTHAANDGILWVDLQPSRHIGQRNPEGPGQPEWRYTNSRSGTSFSVRAGRRLRFCSVLRGPGGRCDKREKGRRCTTGI